MFFGLNLCTCSRPFILSLSPACFVILCIFPILSAAKLRAVDNKMSAHLTLMTVPQEILLMILTRHFSSNVVKIREDARRSRRLNLTELQRKLPACMEILLVNRALYKIGSQAFYNNVTIWCDSIFDSHFCRYILGPMACQVPWNRIRCIAGDRQFGEYLARLQNRAIPYTQYFRDITVFKQFGIS